MTDNSRRVGNRLSLKILRKHIKRLVNYAEAGDGDKIREELKWIVTEYHAESAKGREHRGKSRGLEGKKVRGQRTRRI